MLRAVAVVALLVSLSACDAGVPDEDPAPFVAGEVLVGLRDTVEFEDFRAYVDTQPDLTWGEIIARTAARVVLLKVPVGQERAIVARLEAEAGQYVAYADVNGIVTLD